MAATKNSTFAISTAFVVGAAYLCIGAAFLRFGFPHEDAYILFKFVKNLGSGFGIVYYSGGPHAEGATDFLWLTGLTALFRAGLDPAIAALVLNAIGAAAAAGLIARSVQTLDLSPLNRIFLLGSTALLLFLPSALAGYVGFSAQLYSTGALILYLLYLRSFAHGAGLIPVMALLMALFRPDGAILGAAFVLLGVWAAQRRGELRRFCAITVCCAVAGAGYFLWRYSYFGLPLPLPLYVKGHGHELFPTLALTARWLFILNGRYVALLIVLAIALALQRKDSKLYVLGLLPFALHLLALSTSDQSQNIAYRFEAPCLLVMVYLSIISLARLLDGQRGMLSSCLLPVLLGVTAVPHLSAGLELYRLHTRPEYIERFSFELGKILPAERAIALTEAGRLGYWTNARVFDLVGLNNPDTATRPPSNQYLERIAPDLLMVHSAGMLRTRTFDTNPELSIIEVEQSSFGELVSPEFSSALSTCGNESYKGVPFGNVQMAPLCAADFLSKHPQEYRVILARYQGNFDHLYALRNNLPEFQGILDALKRSYESRDPISYAKFAAGR